MKMARIKIISPVPSFVCPVRYTTVGPLSLGQQTELPEEVAELLVRKNRAIHVNEPFKNFEVN